MLVRGPSMGQTPGFEPRDGALGEAATRKESVVHIGSVQSAVTRPVLLGDQRQGVAFGQRLLRVGKGAP
jgi:hypothetical protein